METLNMFGVDEIKYKEFKDPYQLTGEEKKKCLDEMVEYIETYKKIESPNTKEKNLLFDACNKLRAEAQRQINRTESARNYYDKLKDDLVMAELEAFKTSVKLKFMEKYQKEMESKLFTQEMSKELDRITRAEKSACYEVHGITINIKDCDKCKHKICIKRPKWELEAEEIEKDEEVIVSLDEIQTMEV